MIECRGVMLIQGQCVGIGGGMIPRTLCATTAPYGGGEKTGKLSSGDGAL